MGLLLGSSHRRHTRPDPVVIKKNRTLVDMVLIQAELEQDERFEDARIDRDSYQKHKLLAEELLSLDTGAWGAETITHHCKGILCCPNGIAETRAKLWCAVLVTRR